jgi:hypothetical protein
MPLHVAESEKTMTARKVWWIRKWVECRLATFSEIVVMAWERPLSGDGSDAVATVVRVLYGPGQLRQFELRKPILEVSEHDIAMQVPLNG